MKVASRTFAGRMTAIDSAAPVKILYRSLLRKGESMDRFPILKAFCMDPRRRKVASWYVPELSFRELVRKEFRDARTIAQDAIVHQALAPSVVYSVLYFHHAPTMFINKYLIN